ncbi:zinc finger protein 26 [Patella vulgata]|uniref:zinc finger protein 26 n=1 Tax=Patella vulgata TaxID=6465 RepID=UPI0021808E33|nr:zinc finger protein 26 [Patella vulgata]
MVKRCSWGTCNSDSRYPERLAGGVTFIPFPKLGRTRDKARRWIRLCGRPYEKLNEEILAERRKAKHLFVCSKHFLNGQPDPISAPHYEYIEKSKTSRVSIKSEQVEDEICEEYTLNDKMTERENIVVDAATDVLSSRILKNESIPTVPIEDSLTKNIPFHNSELDETDDVKTFHQCVVCDEIFEEYSDLEVHNKIHIKVEKTDELDEACRIDLEDKTTDVENHSKIHVKEEQADHDRKIHECKLCEEKFELYTDLKEHCQIHFKEEESTECTFHEICYKTINHENTSKNTNSSDVGETLEENWIHPCKKCGKMFSMKTEPKKTIKTKRKKQYKCHVCRETFTHFNSLQEHAKTHGPLKCPVCNQFFIHPSDIRTHMADDHGAFTCHICQICQKMYVNLTDIEAHIRDHSAFNCDTCSKLFTVFPDLYIHIKKSHGSLKPFKCDVCQKSYTHLTNLKLHYEVYDDMKPFMCLKCRKSFNCECNFEIHTNNCNSN